MALYVFEQRDVQSVGIEVKVVGVQGDDPQKLC